MKRERSSSPANPGERWHCHDDRETVIPMEAFEEDRGCLDADAPGEFTIGDGAEIRRQNGGDGRR